MSEDKLLKDLALLVGEHERELKRCEAECAGAAVASTSPQAEMLRPLDAGFRAAMVSRISQELALGDAPAQSQSGTEIAASSLASTVRALLGALAAPLRALAERPALGLSAAAAAIVFAAVGLGVFRADLVGTSSFAAYDLSLQGKAYMRGDEPAAGGPVTFVAGDRFKLLLRPKTALEGTIVARAFTLVGDSVQPLIAPPAQVLDNGVVLIAGEVGADVLLPAGNARLLVVVARPDALPEGAELLRRLDGRENVRTADWEAWSVEIRL